MSSQLPQDDCFHYLGIPLQGQHLDRASQESDVSVQIGSSFCNVTSLSRQQLTCRPPETQPPPVEVEGVSDQHSLPEVVVNILHFIFKCRHGLRFHFTSLLFFVQVVVGGALRYKIGKLSYASLAGAAGPLTKPTVIAIVVVIFVIFVIFLCFLIAYRRKSTESSRVLKNMQEQMDILELRVAAECKEGL